MRKLNKILEMIDFSKLIQVFSHKTKIHPIRTFTIILYTYSKRIYSTRKIKIVCQKILNLDFFCKILKFLIILQFQNF